MLQKSMPAEAAEAEVCQAQRMEIVGQLTGGVVHDFNNILTVIAGTIEILAEAVADRPELAAIARLIDEAAARGASLTLHLLAFARGRPSQRSRSRNVCRNLSAQGGRSVPIVGGRFKQGAYRRRRSGHP